MPEMLRTVSPVDGSVYVERPFASDKQIAAALETARAAQATWRRVPVRERGELCGRAVDGGSSMTSRPPPDVSDRLLCRVLLGHGFLLLSEPGTLS